MKTLSAKDIARIAEGLKTHVGSGKNKIPVLAPGLRIRHETGIEYTIDSVVYADEKRQKVKEVVAVNPLGEKISIKAKNISKYS
jgi:hypothetical protein